jgi:hypothetical protein
MNHVFYFLSVLAILWEIIVVTSPIKVTKFIKSYESRHVDGLTKTQKNLSYCMLGYIVWCLIGLVSSQWVIFLILLLLGIINKRRPILTFITGLLSVLLLIFMLLNLYHFHIDIFSLIKSYF